jgi:hypothetical protein
LDAIKGDENGDLGIKVGDLLDVKIKKGASV